MTELGRAAAEVPDGFYCVKDGIVYKMEVEPLKGKKTIQVKIAADDELQHVGYTPEACGYEK